MIYTKVNLNLNHNFKILFAIIDQAKIKTINEYLFKKMLELTEYSTSKITNKNIIFYESIDSVLEESTNYDYDLIFFQSVGNIIKHNVIIDLIIEYYQKNTDFFISGFVLDWEAEIGKGWLECHHQMLLLNVKTWKKIGKPFFGDWEIKEENLPNYSRSLENFHDKYTPYWVKGEDGITLKTREKQGWNFLKKALENKIKIDNFSQEIRDCRIYLYPEKDSDNLALSFSKGKNIELTNPNQISYFNSINIPKQIWLFNSENYFFQNKTENIGTYFGTASGFKYLDILRKNNDIKMFFYDFNDESLDWIKNLKDNWDGKNLKDFIEKQSTDIKNNFTCINGSIDNNILILKKQFPDFDVLWNKFKKTEVKYIKCNLFNQDDVNKLFKLNIKNKIFFFYSNIFYNDFIILTSNRQEIEEKRKNFIRSLSNFNSEIFLEGCDAFGNWRIDNKKKPILRLFN